MIILYSKQGCPPCAYLKGRLNKANIYFEERNTTENPEYFEEAAKLGAMSFPFTLVGDQAVIGPNISEIMKKLSVVVK